MLEYLYITMAFWNGNLLPPRKDSLFLVLYSAPIGFSPGTPFFPSPQKPTSLNSNSIPECMGISELVLDATWVNKIHIFIFYEEDNSCAQF